MTIITTRRRRSGRTEKISISLDRADLAMLKKRAGRVHGGNISAAIAEGVQRVREEEGREALVRWLGDTAKATPAQRAAVREEWRDGPARRHRHRVA